MRISTSTLFSQNVSQLDTLQNNLVQTQQQISTGRRILTPADDPAGAARALQVSQTDATNTQYLTNIGTAQDAVTLSEGTLQSITTLIQNMQTTAVQAGNLSTMTDTDRKALASTLQANLDQLVSQANTKDAVGNYLFSGFKGATQPFVQTSTGVQYNGDDGQRMTQVSANEQMATSDSGANIFMRIKNGNGTFVAQPDPTSNGGTGNTGSGVINSGSLAVPPPTTAQLGNTYTISFSVAAGGVTTYTVTGKDATGATLPTVAQPLPPLSLPSAQPYTNGQTISFNGIQFAIQGAPASGDQFTIQPSTNESVFTTVSNLIKTLSTPTNPSNPASVALLTAGINNAMAGLNNSLNSVLTAEASQGARLNQLTALTTNANNLGLQYKQTLSNLQDLDYNAAVSNLTQEQTILTAAQKSFVQVENLSMFNYLP